MMLTTGIEGVAQLPRLGMLLPTLCVPGLPPVLLLSFADV